MGESNLHDEVQSLRQRLADCEHSDEALRISQERLRVITDSVPVLISYIDNTFTYRFVNRGYERWFGMSRDELIGRRVPDVLDEAAFDRSKPYLDRVLAGEEVEFEGKAQNEDGSIKYFLTHCVPDRGDDGEVKGYFAVVSDISEVTTATLALRQSETRLRSVIEGIPLVLWATDAQGVFTLSEGRSLQRLGLSPGEVVGCSLFEVYADVPEVVSSARRALEGEAHSGTVRVAGLVVVHQAPPTAKGVRFITLEDEWGFINIVVRPTAYNQYRRVLRHAALLVMEGQIQQRDGIVNVLCERAFAMSPV